jgi:transcriptional regulator GlxA family with amidase domain
MPDSYRGAAVVVRRLSEYEGYLSLRTGGRLGKMVSVPTPEREVVLVAFEGVQLLDVVGPSDILDAATRLLGGDGGYRMAVATPDGQPVRGSGGLRLDADLALGQVRRRGVDTVIVGGGLRIDDVLGDPRLAPALRRIGPGARRICSVCAGAFLLAEAGLLEGRAATTHWAFCDELARRHPGVRVEPDRIFVRDGPVSTSAGMTAGMDLALALVEEDHGPEIARTVARWTVMFLQRPGGQSQFSERLALPATVAPPIRETLDRIAADPAGDHRLPQLARQVSLSERHLRRLFAEQTGTTPARFIERIRVEAARDLLADTATPIDTIAGGCGFGSPETMRRAFLRVLGVGPADYRARFRSSAHSRSPAVRD